MDSIAVPVGLLVVSACACMHLYVKEPGKLGRVRLRGSALDEAEEDDAEHDDLHGNGSSSSHFMHNGYEDDDEDGSDNEDRLDEDSPGPSWMVQDGTSEEGVPVEIEKWWYKVRMRKAALVILFALTDTVACLALGWNAINNPKNTLALVEDSLMVVYWVGLHAHRMKDS